VTESERERGERGLAISLARERGNGKGEKIERGEVRGFNAKRHATTGEKREREDYTRWGEVERGREMKIY
jgi:hypothetical protein